MRPSPHEQASYAGVRALRRFVAPAVARCDFCRLRLPEPHGHLVEPETLKLFCACPACAEQQAAAGLRHVTPRQEVLAHFDISDADWAALQIPIEVAFLFAPEAGGSPMALFPGPAGATSAQLSAETWADLAGRYPLLGDLEPAAEALLVDRAGGRRRCYRVSVDHCYALAGLMRSRWRGLSGGEEAWAAIEGYFADLDRSAATVETEAEAAHA